MKEDNEIEKFNQLDIAENVDWLKLDDITWSYILEYLDSKSLLNATEACPRFEDVFNTSRKLLKKVKISLKFPDETLKTDKSICDFPGPSRRYQHLDIIQVRDELLCRNDIRSSFFNIIAKLSSTVTTLLIHHCQITRKDLVKIMRQFSQLEECDFLNLSLHDDVAPADVNINISCPNLKKLVFKQSDFICLFFFKSHESLESLCILEPHYIRTDVEELENFLLKQSKLKELKLVDFRFNSTFSTNRLANVPFQLEVLSLNHVNWDIQEHQEAFLRSQISLKTFELKSFNRMFTGDSLVNNYRWFCGIMQHMFTRNPQLHSLSIDTKGTNYRVIKDEDFLIDIVNNKITNLTYIKGDTDESELLKIFTRLFPKVKVLAFSDASEDSKNLLELILRFTDLESLEIKVAPKSLSSFQLTSNKIKTFKYFATNEEKSIEKLTEIFMNNPSITQLALNIEPLTIQEITELLLPLSQSLESINIADLHLNKEEAEMIVKNFPKLRKICSDFQLNATIVDILKSANISFEFKKFEFLNS